MKTISIFQTGPDGAFPDRIREAARLAFGEPEFIPLFPGTAPPECSGPEMLWMASGTAEDAARAALAQDAEDLPRWAVLRFADDALPIQGWLLPQLVGLLKEAAARHELARENARLRGDLLTMSRRIGHDLRTPLGGLLATLDMLAETVPSGPALTQPVFASVDEITRIINRTGLLLKATSQPLAKSPVQMGLVVHAAIERLQRPLMEKQAIIHQPGTWPEIPGVGPWLEVIWWNLLHNAIHHGGAAPLIRLEWEPLPQGWRFLVLSPAPGPAKSAPADSFPAFHRLHDTNASRGLGLAIVRRLTELQGGQCGGFTHADGSAVFHFTLPAA